MRRMLSTGRAHSVFDRLTESPIGWILPACLFLAVFQLYPLIEVIRLSLTNSSLIRPETSYIGLQNYETILTGNQLPDAVVTTTWYVASNLILQIGLGLLFAILIDYGVRNKLRGSLLTRLAIMSAWIVPGIIVGFVWRIMLLETEYGLLNFVLIEAGIGAVSFLSDPWNAFASVIVADVWRGVAFSMILLYAGLKRVPDQLYRAAKIDGAGAIARYRYVVLPQLKGIAFIVTILVSINSLNTFDLIFSLTEGGPGKATTVLSLLMYNLGFTSFETGRASAAAVVLLVITMGLAVIYIWAYDLKEAI